MQEYEIRILRADGGTATVFEGIYLSDHSAIRAAKRMAEERRFEVWRGMDCIYGGHYTASPDAPPRHPATS